MKRTLPTAGVAAVPRGAGRTDVEHLARFVERHRRLFVLSGAGCSTPSGIPDYRDHRGEWKRRHPVQYRDFLSNERTRRRYWLRSMLGWPRVASARPNGAHRALARLESAGRLEGVVTQNVDGLHQRAGSRRVTDLHGRLDTVVCLACGKRDEREAYQHVLEELNPHVQSLSGHTAPDGDVDLEGIDVEGFRVPSCPHCGGLVKPDVVFFGESVPRARVDQTLRLLAEATGVLVVGSSLMVYSGYRFCRAAAAEGKPIAAVNLGRTRADALITLKIDADCEAILQALMARLGLRQPFVP